MTLFFDFIKAVDAERLHIDIIDSGLMSVLEHVHTLGPTDVRIAVDNSITPTQEATLSGIVDAHINIPLPQDPETSGVFVHTINDLSGLITLTVNQGDAITKQQINEGEATFDITAVRSLNGLTSVVSIGSGVSNLIEFTTSETSGIILDIDPTRLETVLTLSGISKLIAAEELTFASTTSTTFVEFLSLAWNAPTSGVYRVQWSFEGSASSNNKVCEFRIQVDDSAVLSDLMLMTTSFNVTNGNLQFGGFAQFDKPDGDHFVDFDMRFADTGGFAAEVANLRLEILRIT